jgi:hypothetical protein
MEGAMKFKLWFFIFVCSLVSGTCFAQNKVVVVPFFHDTDVLTCKGTIVGTRWCDQENGTVKDMTTGLIWLKNAAWGGAKVWRINSVCNHPDVTCHDDAHQRAASLSDGAVDAGLTDGSVEGEWRLPTKAEIQNLSNGEEAVRSNSMRAFTGVLSFYWTSSSVVGNESAAYAINMENGVVGNGSKDGEGYV